MPLGGIFAEIGARDVGALVLDRAQTLQIERDRRIGIAARCHELSRQRPDRARLPQTIKDPAAFAETIEEAGLAQQLQVTRNPWLALPQDLGKLAHRQLTARAENDEPQPGRFGYRAQHSQ